MNYSRKSVLRICSQYLSSMTDQLATSHDIDNDGGGGGATIKKPILTGLTGSDQVVLVGYNSFFKTFAGLCGH